MSDYIELADGTKIDKKTGEVLGDKREEIKASTDDLLPVESDDLSVDVSELKQHLVATRHIKDLPGDVNTSRAIAVVLSLSLYGLSDAEIATVCGIEYEQVLSLKSLEGYENFMQAVLENVMNAHSNNVRHMFVKNAKFAAENIISGLNSKIPEVRALASKEVLDRGGFRPADIVEHRVTHENELKIVYIKDDKNTPIIELDRI